MSAVSELPLVDHHRHGTVSTRSTGARGTGQRGGRAWAVARLAREVRRGVVDGSWSAGDAERIARMVTSGNARRA
ncbi:MAG TPA: hypothetical protein VK640_14695 [Actinomycetes bacterium]|nr:hypothetical protein [Actinomycetes bacterium]